MVSEIVKANFKSLLFTVAGTLIALGYAILPKGSPDPKAGKEPSPALPAVSPAMFLPPAAALAPVPAAQPGVTYAPVNPSETLTFTVMSTGRGSSGAVWLNSQPNFRLPGNQSIRLPAGAVADGSQFLGKTVTATGIGQHRPNGGREIAVPSLAAVQVR